MRKVPIWNKALFLQLIFISCFGQISLVSSLNTKGEEAPLSSLLKELQAECTREGIKVKLWFKRPFSGIAYSHGHYETAKCRYIDQVLGPSGTNFSFLIPMSECGTVYYGGHESLMRGTNLDKNNDNEVYIENTLLIQNDATIQEATDFAKTLRCVWQKEIHQPLMASLPIGNIKSKLTSSKRGEAQRVRTVSGGSLGHFNATNRNRFQMKGQVQSVPVYGRREHARALQSYEDDENYSEEDGLGSVVKLIESSVENSQEDPAISALPLRSGNESPINISNNTNSLLSISVWKLIVVSTLLIKHKLIILLVE